MAREGSIVPLFGTATEGASPVVSAQRRSNFYVEMPKDAEKGQIALYPRAGLTYFSNPGGVSIPVRGLFESFPVTTPFDGVSEYGVGVVGSTLFAGNRSTGFNGVSSILTESGPLDFALNPTQLLVVDGRTGYVFTVNDSSFTKVTLEGLLGAEGFPAGTQSVAFLAGRGFAVQPRTGKLWYSELNDFTAWDSLAFYTAESDPDDLRAVWNHYGQLALFGQFTTEFWAPGSGSTTLQRVGGAAMEWGIAARQSLKRTDAGTIFVGQNRLGDLKVLRMQGYQAAPISTPEIEYQLQSLPIESAVGMAYSVNGHTFYNLAFPEVVLSYDATTNTWNRPTTGTNGQRFIGQYGALIRGDFIVSDYRNNRLSVLDPTVYTDSTETIVREVVTRHTFNDYDRVTVDWLEVDFEVGVGLVSGQGSDPQVMLQVSRDNGRTWGNELWRDLGAVGDYRRRVRWGPLGRARDWLFRIRVSDPVKVVITGGALKVRP